MYQLIQVDVGYRAPTAKLWYIQNHTKELVHASRAHVEYRASTPDLSCETHTRTHTHTLLQEMHVEYRGSTPELSCETHTHTHTHKHTTPGNASRIQSFYTRAFFLVCFFLSEYN